MTLSCGLYTARIGEQKAKNSGILLVVSELRTCRVSFQDTEGIAHSVGVTAQSLFEAAALAIKAFRAAEWMQSGPGVGTARSCSQ